MDFPAIDPVLITIPGLPIDIRWYGITYIIGFFVGQWILVRLARANFLPIDPKVAPDIIFYCVIGVMLGGRIGYALFYDQALLNPIQFLQVWKGGLAFHGGLAGVAVACWFFVRRHDLGWGRVADSCALAVTPGIFSVRMANFINGELYGRITDAGTWFAMQFPTDPMAKRVMQIPALEMRDTELCIQYAYRHVEWADIKDQLASHDLHGAEIDWASVQPHLDWEVARAMTDTGGALLVPFRHPSQLHEGFGEGLLLGLAMLVLYLVTRKKPLSPGRYAAIFLLGYAAIRGLCEFVREPDPQYLHAGQDVRGAVFLGMTMGQTLSALLVVGALLILFWPRRRD